MIGLTALAQIHSRFDELSAGEFQVNFNGDF